MKEVAPIAKKRGRAFPGSAGWLARIKVQISGDVDLGPSGVLCVGREG